MSIKLSHVGEVLIAEMLTQSALRRQLNQFRCAVTGVSLADDIQNQGLDLPARFIADEASLSLRCGGNNFSCDGAQTVDVLCAGQNDRAIAFEAKLGKTRMSVPEFKKRFAVPCEISRHKDARLRGSMVAVLDRALPISGDLQITASVADREWTVAKPWWLVIRATTFAHWRVPEHLPIRHARVLLFDQIARTFGSRDEFDELVKRIIGSDFGSRWDLHF